MLSSLRSKAWLSPASSRCVPRLGCGLRASSPPLQNVHSRRVNAFHPPSASPSSAVLLPAVPRMSFSAPRGSLIGHIRAFDRPSWSLHSLFSAPPRELTDSEIEHLLSLAQLRVPAPEMGALKAHLQSFLAFLESVKAADAGGCQPMHALPCPVVTASLRAQDVACDNAALEAVLCNASWQQESMFAVPKAIDD